jgi:Rrf2 family protein
MARIVTLTEAASIALHAMVLLGRSKGNAVNVDQIAETTNSSRHHVAKVMQRLAKSGFVGSYRGPNGGFHIIRAPKKITLLEIYETIEGKIIPSSCPMEKPICSFDRCFLNNITHDMTAQFKKYLSEQTLSDYI